MIYLDTSVALAYLLTEDHRPSEELWYETLVSSRLLSYELWVRLHARELAASHGEATNRLIGRVGLIEMSPIVLARALDSFPGEMNVRTLAALHLASCAYLIDRGQRVALASYDRRMNSVARAMGIPLIDPDGN